MRHVAEVSILTSKAGSIVSQLDFFRAVGRTFAFRVGGIGLCLFPECPHDLVVELMKSPDPTATSPGRSELTPDKSHNRTSEIAVAVQFYRNLEDCFAMIKAWASRRFGVQRLKTVGNGVFSGLERVKSKNGGVTCGPGGPLGKRVYASVLPWNFVIIRFNHF